MNNEERNYSLLRQFFPVPTMLGETMCGEDGTGQYVYMAGPTSGGEYAFEDKLLSRVFVATFQIGHRWKLQPLTWLQGNPLYKGDTIYFTVDGSKHVVESFTGTYIICGKGFDEFAIHPDYASWEKPKVKKNYWVNLYPSDTMAYDLKGHMHDTPEQARIASTGSRLVTCVMITIEE